jgi:hypothetical protein
VGRDAIRAWGLGIDNRQNGIHHVVSNPRFVNVETEQAD